MYSVAYVLYRKEGMSHEEFVAYWRDVHGPIVRAVPGLRTFETMAVTSCEDVKGGPIDGIARLSFDSREDFEKATETAAWQAGVEDTPEFIRQLGTLELEVKEIS